MDDEMSQALGSYRGPRNEQPQKASFVDPKADLNSKQRQSYKLALAMEAKGARPEDIWRETKKQFGTSWMKDKDGQWWGELPDWNTWINRDATIGVNATPLGNILDAEDLFKARPELRNMPVRWAKPGEGGMGGGGYRMTPKGEIVIQPFDVALDISEDGNTLGDTPKTIKVHDYPYLVDFLREMLLHESGHHSQRMAGAKMNERIPLLTERRMQFTDPELLDVPPWTQDNEIKNLPNRPELDDDFKWKK